MYVWHDISGPKDIRAIVGSLSSEYAEDSIADLLANNLSGSVRGILVERDYVDKDYRSVFYNFYAKKGDEFKRNCVRLHLFAEDVVLSCAADGLRIIRGENVDDEDPDDVLSRRYLGYVVLRPTGGDNIGRSVISPKALIGVAGGIITARHKVHVLGHRLNAVGFPWMMQHRDISVCAHVACWSILRHYSERYSKYAEFLLHEITKLAQPYDPGGMVPAAGLALQQAERIFYATGTFPLLIRKERESAAFLEQVFAYLESGFPLFAALNSKEHAVAIVGVKWSRFSATRGAVSVPQPVFRRAEALIVSDDQQLPYAYMRMQRSGQVVGLSVEDIDAILVPLPEKIFYPASSVRDVASHARTLFKELVFPPKNGGIKRYYVTTTAALRRHFRDKAVSFDPKMVQAVMEMPMAQFVWVVEYSSDEQWQQGEVAVTIVLDATASVRDNEPFWLAFDSKTALLWRERKGANQQFVELKLEPAERPYFRIQSNLDHFAG
ncbi:hypothetical protein [Paraburkholderia sp. BCC1884]|uniref:hypothetical protein n=1 Tax=Paraburkholderia sp. BCC1884 TaxID=2562668 RepID=UPI001181F02D|nr:hypothetical protein [Paraburkholderia sp. BCC1884]